MPIADRLLQIQQDSELKLGVHALTGEYEIVYCLLDADRMAPKELQTYSRLSSTAFYQTLKRLDHLGFVEAEVNPEDRRGLLYRLSPSLRGLVMSEHKGYRELVINNYRYKAAASYELSEYKSFIHRSQGISHLTADFQILLYLYLKSGISNLEMSDMVDVSPTKFNQSLKKLLGMGLIDFNRNPADNRGKCYYVTDKTREALDDQHRRVFRWVAERLGIE
jgi:DNA-binding MarR family transcriptional regulator